MRLTQNNTIAMTARELSGILLQNPTNVSRAQELIQLYENRPKKRVKSSKQPMRKLRITDQQHFRLLRVAAEFTQKVNAHGILLDLWARRSGARASVEELLFEAERLNPPLDVNSPLAWVRMTIKQALLRGDAEEVSSKGADLTQAAPENGKPIESANSV